MSESAGVWELLISGDASIWHPAGLSLACGSLSTLLAAPAGIAVGLLVGLGRGRWQRPLRAVVDAGLALPTTAVALVCYLLLSRNGPLGGSGLLFTWQAIVLGQTLITFPVIVILVADAAAALPDSARWTARTLGAARARRLVWYAGEIRATLLAALLTAFGRATGELGVALILGGNIKGSTRTLTTAITLYTARGMFEEAVALGVLLVLFALAVIVTVRLALPGGRVR